MDCLGKADPDEPALILGYWHAGPHRSLYVVATEVRGAMGWVRLESCTGSVNWQAARAAAWRFARATASAGTRTSWPHAVGAEVTRRGNRGLFRSRFSLPALTSTTLADFGD
jgi:hypothetical protein